MSVNYKVNCILSFSYDVIGMGNGSLEVIVPVMLHGLSSAALV